MPKKVSEDNDQSGGAMTAHPRFPRSASRDVRAILGERTSYQNRLPRPTKDDRNMRTTGRHPYTKTYADLTAAKNWSGTISTSAHSDPSARVSCATQSPPIWDGRDGRWTATRIHNEVISNDEGSGLQ